MASTNYYEQQLSAMQEPPDFRRDIVAQYDQPVLRPLVEERAGLESQYLPAMFQPFAQMGTSAADMSPAAKLNLMGGSLGRLMSRVGANQDMQKFYDMQIDNLANTAMQGWQAKRQSLMDMYNLAAQRAAANRAAGIFGGGFAGGGGDKTNIPAPYGEVTLNPDQEGLGGQLKRAGQAAFDWANTPVNFGNLGDVASTVLISPVMGASRIGRSLGDMAGNFVRNYFTRQK